MTWDRYHSISEKLAIEADLAARAGESNRAEDLYRQAAVSEADAFNQLSTDKDRTRGITAVSAVALWYKGRAFAEAERLAHSYLGAGRLPLFAQTQLRELLQIIWTAHGAEGVGVRFVPGDVLISVKGGQVIYGGAPLDLIVRKVEGVRAVLFRTVEMLLQRPFRRRGAPEPDIQSMFRPWLVQAPAGSYQFAVRMQAPDQMGLWEADRPRVEQVNATFLKILRASTTDPEHELPTIVDDTQYREAFLSLSRNLSPTGKTFSYLEVRDAGAPSDPVATFAASTRQQLNAALRKAKPPRSISSTDEPTTLYGILRAVHLDQDWLEVATLDVPPGHIRIDDAGDALDDVVGPMVNHRVSVAAVRRGQKYLYRDIELDD